MKKVKLTPVDRKRCQAETRVGAFQLGPQTRPALTRCSKVPTVVATEAKPGPDGQIGAMSLCDECATVLALTRPGLATTAPIRRRKARGA